MQGFYVDLTLVAAILVAGALLMIPVLGLTLRLVLPPIMESVMRARAARPVRLTGNAADAASAAAAAETPIANGRGPVVPHR